MVWIIVLVGAAAIVAATLGLSLGSFKVIYRGQVFWRNRKGEFFDDEGRAVSDGEVRQQLEQQFQVTPNQSRMESRSLWLK